MVRYANQKDYTDIITTFRLYRDIFPHLKPIDIKKSIDKKEVVWDSGVVIHYNKYQRSRMKGDFKTMIGDVNLKKMASKNGGVASKVFNKWLKDLGSGRVVLTVRDENIRAIRFYDKQGFVKASSCKWSKDIDGTVMVLEF